MQSTEDSALLRQYVGNNSEEAFAALVTRHVNLVYSVALRQVGNPHHAEEITQAVFIILARKVGGLRHDKALSSWLFQTTHLTANNFVRSEIRRQRREQEAHMQTTLNESESEIWPSIAPLLDTAVAGLNEKDRRAIVLRFYEGRNLSEVGAALGASEDAAKKRVNRAVEKLRAFFAKRGVIFPATVLAAAISANSVQAAPTVLAKTATAVAFAKGATASTSTLTLIKGVLKVMAWAKAQTAIAIGTTVLLAAGTTAVVVNDLARSEAAIAPEKLSPEDAFLAGDLFARFRYAPPALIVRTTRFPTKTFASCYETGKFAYAAGRNVEFTGMLTAAYHFKPPRMILPPDLPTTNFDFLVTLPDCPNETFQAAIKNTLGWTAHTEMRERDVLLLKVKIADAPGLRTGTVTNHSSRWLYGNAAYHATNMPISDLKEFLENEIFRQPVLDQTGLTNQYDIVLDWREAHYPSVDYDSLKKVLLAELGLELVSGREKIEMLVVEQVKTNPSK